MADGDQNRICRDNNDILMFKRCRMENTSCPSFSSQPLNYDSVMVWDQALRPVAVEVQRFTGSQLEMYKQIPLVDDISLALASIYQSS